MTTQFSPEDIAGVCGYMNDSAMRANLTAIVQWSAKDESITDAEMTHFDSDGFDALASRASGTETIRVLWSYPIASRAEVRDQMFSLFEKAAFG